MHSHSFAEYYHEKTKYDPETIRRQQRRLNFGDQPSAFKLYEVGKRFALRPFFDFDSSQVNDHDLAMERLLLPPDQRAIARLSHLLYFTNGITAMVPYPGRPFFMRAAPSAGALYPTELYLALRNQPGLPDGIYHYQVRNHALICYWEGDAWETLLPATFHHPAIEASECVVIATGVFERSAWRYQDRAYRRILLDTGHVIGNLELYAPQVDWKTNVVGGFSDGLMNDLLFLDGESEATLMLLALNNLDATFDEVSCTSALASGTMNDFRPVADGQRLNYLHKASCLDIPVYRPFYEPPDLHARRDAKLSISQADPLVAPPLDWQHQLGPTIFRRRSTRRYTGAEITRDQLAEILSFAYRDDLTLSYCDLGALETFVAVHNVAGLDPGCYHYSPEHQTIRQIRFKTCMKEVQYLCLDQELAGKAAAVILHTAHLASAVDRYGDRAYRYLHLDAGHLGQRLNLAAVHLGLGASGIAGFYDDLVNDLLGIPEDEGVLYLTTIGQPEDEIFHLS